MEELTKEERARITDTRHNVQAATDALSGVDRKKVPNIEAIEECLEGAEATLRDLLRKPGQPAQSSGRNN